MLRSILFALLVIGIAGCGTFSSDVGMVDYYRVGDDNGTPVCGTEENCRKLVLKYADTGQPAILPTQYFSINLSTAFIGEFFEFGMKGEIAIVARVSERRKGSLEWGSEAADSGRLIYYSDYVKQHQTLSMSYIPVYGPVPYSGNPVDIQLYIFEIDNADQYRPLLHTLTSIGQKAYPPASPVLSVLDSLGSALLKGSRNDRLFEYSLCLWPRGPISDGAGYEGGHYPVLEAGHYVFTRFKDRKENADLLIDDLGFSLSSNKLVVDDEEKGKTVYNKDSYIVLHVKRDDQGFDLADENNFYKTFAAFKKSESETTREYIDNIDAELGGLRDKLIHNHRIKDVYSLYTGVGSALKGQEPYVRANATKLLFALREQIKERSACDADPKKACKEIMTRQEIDELLALMKLTKSFAPVADQLTYEALPKADVADMVSKVVAALPENVSGT